jgi:excisionase family DNA binding protein
VTTKEAADRLGLTPRSVARLIRNKKIAAHWNIYARRMEIAEEEVDRYQKERKSAGRPKRGNANEATT